MMVMSALDEVHVRLDEYLGLASTSFLPNDLETPFSTHISFVNFVPGPQDIPFIDAVVSERNSQLSGLSCQIAQVESAMSKLVALRARLEESRSCVRDSMMAHHTLTSSVRRIPPEVLGEIFYHCLPGTPFLTPRNAECPMVLTQVCHLWRAVAMSSPRLWSSVTIHLQKALCTEILPGYDTWLARAKGVPLSIRVLNNVDIVVTTTHITLPRFVVPRSLSTGVAGYGKGPRPSTSSLDAVTLPWDQLTELNIHCPLVSGSVFLRILQLCNNMRSIVASCLCADEEGLSELSATAPGSITHHSLRRIEIKVIRAGVDQLFDALVLPALEELDICFCSRERDPWPHAQFMSLLTRSRCPLKQLTIRSNKNAVPHFAEYKKALPSLSICTSTPRC
ncbi:hypothetical protein BU15DRAFT_61745 [Melanogaster broomeanus]|nr:hypothetical protein BU15DRAFT_61745 [Melanogaster broomeanus]